ncbi:MAG: helix-turn-helix domain-containing protein [Treponemataceae bacterium]|nr:helix-turn-helix domain-containing protein [Treponemataceae bacterium]
MESLGEKLRKARENLGLSYEDVYRDTNISIRYLEALEKEEFSQFPGEPYLLGFLRNYGEYLGLNAQELLSQYRSMKLQEQPVPIEQLLKDPEPSPRWPLLGIGFLALLGLVGGVLVWLFLIRGHAETVENASPRKATEYTLTGGILKKRLYPGDSLLVTIAKDTYKLELLAIDEQVHFSTASGEVVINLGQEIGIDLNNDGNKDLQMYVEDLVKNKPERGASLRFEYRALVQENTQNLGTGPASSGIPAVAQSAETGTIGSETAGTGGTTGTSAIGPVILSSPNPYPFTLQVTFKGSCLFRWEADKKERNEQYFQKADILNIQAQNGIRLWVSNATAAKVQVIGGGKTVDVEIGNPGEVVVTDIKWIKDDDGRYRLVPVRLD